MSDTTTRIPGVIESPTITMDHRTDDEYREQLRKALNALDGQFIVLPNDVRIEAIEPNPEAWAAYRRAVELADHAINLAIMGPVFIEGNRYADAADVLNVKYEVAP